jgi:hypothetical protein
MPAATHVELVDLGFLLEVRSTETSDHGRLVAEAYEMIPGGWTIIVRTDDPITLITVADNTRAAVRDRLQALYPGLVVAGRTVEMFDGGKRVQVRRLDPAVPAGGPLVAQAVLDEALGWMLSVYNPPGLDRDEWTHEIYATSSELRRALFVRWPELAERKETTFMSNRKKLADQRHRQIRPSEPGKPWVYLLVLANPADPTEVSIGGAGSTPARSRPGQRPAASVSPPASPCSRSSSTSTCSRPTASTSWSPPTRPTSTRPSPWPTAPRAASTPGPPNPASTPTDTCGSPTRSPP